MKPKQKPVRIDDKTVILVYEGIPDEKAKSEFIEKLEMNRKLRENYKPYRT